METIFNFQTILQDNLVLLQPLQVNDFESLFEVASDSSIWEQHPAKERSQRDGFAKFFDEAITTKKAFLIIDKFSNQVIGTSRYNLSKESTKAIEIGWTFLNKNFWGGDYNRHIKNLMLAHAFTHFEVVLFYVDKNNFRSQKAVEKIGGKRIDTIYGVKIESRINAEHVYGLKKEDFKI